MSGKTRGRKVQCGACGYAFEPGHRATCPRCLVDLAETPPVAMGTKKEEIVFEAEKRARKKAERPAASGKGAAPSGKHPKRESRDARALAAGVLLGAVGATALGNWTSLHRWAAEVGGWPVPNETVIAAAALPCATPVIEPALLRQAANPVRLVAYQIQPTAYGHDIAVLKFFNSGDNTLEDIEITVAGRDATGEEFETNEERVDGPLLPERRAVLRFDTPPKATVERIVVRLRSEARHELEVDASRRVSTDVDLDAIDPAEVASVARDEERVS